MVGLNMCDWTSCSSETFTAKCGESSHRRWHGAMIHRSALVNSQHHLQTNTQLPLRRPLVLLRSLSRAPSPCHRILRWHGAVIQRKLYFAVNVFDDSPNGEEHDVQSHMLRPTITDMQGKYCGNCYDIHLIQSQCTKMPPPQKRWRGRRPPPLYIGVE